jgi:formylglycine-generating enzyme required for sulfatase activity
MAPPNNNSDQSSLASSEPGKEASLSTNSGTGDAGIEATRFVPSDESKAATSITKWHVVLGISVCVSIFIFWFLFTSKSVQLRFNPPAAEVAISGGFAFELGGVYLLREGDYVISADVDLHEPMAESITVDGRRNQVIDLAFTPLAGFLDLTLTPGDTAVAIDGKETSAIAMIELAAGQHELAFSHPRYLAQAQIIDIQGKQIEQALNVELEPNWAEVSIVSTPVGAQVLVDGELLPLTTPTVIEALAGEREITVQLAGYKTHRERLFAQAGLALVLAPITLVQADAQLFLSSTPIGAGVTVNGNFVGQTPVQLDLKSDQKHSIQIIQNGFKTATRSASLQRGESARIHANLVLQKGEVIIRSEPEGGELTIDGQSVGSANQVLQLPIRAHKLEITLADYAGYRTTITPKVGLTQEVKVRLLTLAEARLQALTPNITTAAGQNLKLFEPFAFSMGASRREPGRRANETLHEVDMSRLFYIATHEVTNGQFRKFASGHDSGAYEEVTLNEDDMPVVKVSWAEAASYCNWLSDRDGLARFYDVEFGKVTGTNQVATGYRLATEAEWTWAARTLLNPASDQLRFPWGSNLPPPDRHGNYADRAASNLVGRIIFGYNDNQTAAAVVGSFKPNHRGLFDMGGNVAEWINDFYEIPGKEPASDPTGPQTGDYHVIRGSSWMHGTITELRYSFRDYGVAGRQDVGFRIARYAE